MRKLLLAIILMVGVVFVLTRFAEVQNIAVTLQRGKWYFILLGIVAQAAFLIVAGASYRSIYRLLGMEENLLHMVTLAASATFVNIIAPTGGMSGIAIFIADARRRGLSAARVMVAGALYVLFDYVGFLLVLILGLAVLARRNNLNWAEITASIILMLVAMGMTAILYLGMRSAHMLAAVLVWGARLVNRIVRPFIHRPYLSEERAHEFAHEIAEGIQAMRANPSEIAVPILLAIANKTVLIGILLVCFLAFQVPLSIGTLIAGFSIGYLFLIISPTPAGVGVVEGVLTLSLTSMWVSLADATVVVVSYRGITFWLNLLLGMIAFRFQGKFARANKLF